MPSAPARVFCVAAAVSLTVSALVYFAFSWRWPLVGDTSLMHYIGFLIQRGWAPYRQFGDMNMPGAYLVEMAAMHVFGPGDLAWRFFDFALMLCGSAAFFVVTRDRHWLAPLFAASLFIVTHGRDGLAQGGQRDLVMAICLIAATAFLFISIRNRSAAAAAAFGLLSGLALTIKPTAILLTIPQLVLALYVARSPADASGQTVPPSPRFLLAGVLAWFAAPLAVLLFLLREHSLAAFLYTLRTVVPYYASLGHRPLSFVLVHSLSTLEPLVIGWLALLLMLPRPVHDWRRNALLLGVAFGILNCVIQARALPYYRYPLLVFLLPAIAIDLTRALDSPYKPGAPTMTVSSSWIASAARVVALLGLAFGAFFLAPRSAFLIHRYHWWENDFISSLEQNLNTLGGQQLSRKVLCIDTNSGCGNALYHLRLEPSNGILSDFFLFGDSAAPAVRQTRAQLTASFASSPPQVLIVTSALYLGGDAADDYRKLARWPEFASFLAAHYTLTTEWHPTHSNLWWSRPEIPASYRIYVLRK